MKYLLAFLCSGAETPRSIGQPISQSTALSFTQHLQNAAESGEVPSAYPAVCSTQREAVLFLILINNISSQES